MSIHIIDDETHEEVAMSTQGKYFSEIADVFLPEGSYYLVIKNDRARALGDQHKAPLRFVLDVVRQTMPLEHQYLEH